jgi:HSP20 family protein
MANITRWNPFAEFAPLQERFNQLFNTFGPTGMLRMNEPPVTFTNFVPPVDVFEDAHNIIVQVELPGIFEKDLDITIENNVLTIAGERKLENEEKKENFHMIERSYGKFTRSFTLPPVVDTENVNAEFINGVLKVTLNKLEEHKPKQIKIGVKTSGVKTSKAA